MQWLYQQGSSHWQLSCNVFAIENKMRWGGCAQSFSGPRGNTLARYSLLNQEKHWAYPPMHELIIKPSTMFLSVIFLTD